MKTLSFSLFFLFSTAIFAQDFDTYDQNNDGVWDENEFAETNDDDYDLWDTDSDGLIDDDEFNETTFRTTDRDRDERINENEWNEGSERMYGDYTGTNDFDDFDTNRDDAIDTDEWNEGFADNDGWFDTYDRNRDGSLDNDEWNTGLFNDWDDDGDGFLNEEEYAVNESFYERNDY